MAQKQTKKAEQGKEPLVCTYRNCKKLQCADGEFCKKHIDDRPRCDNCGKLATRNLQQCWVEWSIDKKGNYSDDAVGIEDCNGDNCHYCDNCEY